MQEHDIVTWLRKKGYRMTKARVAIIEQLCTTTRPASAADTHAVLKKKRIPTNATTVYRELQFLTREGFLSTVHFKDGVVRYELASLPHHHHLVCTSCNDVKDIHMESDLRAVEKDIASKTGFAVAHHALEFYGTCRRCR